MGRGGTGSTGRRVGSSSVRPQAGSKRTLKDADNSGEAAKVHH